MANTAADGIKMANTITHGDVQGGTLEGFKFDLDICKQAFDYYDTNKSGTLDKSELLRLAEVLWDTFYPNGPKIDAKTKEFMVQDIVGTVDKNGDMQISFQEFIPWYKRMAEKHWRATHGGAPVTFEPPKSEAPKLAAAPPAKPKLPIPKPASKCIEVTGTGPQMFTCRITNKTYYGRPCACN